MTTTLHQETFVPGNHLMAGLLGTRDEHLRQIEGAFPDEQIVVQGNRITAEGPAAEVVVRLFDELILMVQSGRDIDSSTLARTIDMVREDIRPSVHQRVVAVGPEGGWSTDELASGLPTVGFGLSVLRAETAAVTAGALLASLRTGTVAAAEQREDRP